MTSEKIHTKWFRLLMLALAVTFTACGGGGSSSPATTAISGSVTAAPVGGASLNVYDDRGNKLAGPVATATDGRYTINLADAHLTQALVFVANGGTYTDEATGAVTTASALSAYLPAGTLQAGSSVHLTPASTLVHELVMVHGRTHTEAQNAVQMAFGFTADTTIMPADATNPFMGAQQAELLAGLRAAAFSQLTHDLGLSADAQFALLVAIARDIADGQFDGMDMGAAITVGAVTVPLDIQNRFTHALLNFHGSANDHTGLANSQVGPLKFATLALSNTYRFEYVAGMMDAMQGKTSFMLQVSRRDDGTPVSGLMLTMMPMMYMDTHMHSTPQDGCTETMTAGIYQCTLYYLMASSMMNNVSMGYWQLQIMAGMGETATFYPHIMMAMGDTTRATLKGQTDMISGMMMPEQRSYYLFRDGLSGNSGNHTFNLFIAAKESMMSYPAVSLNTVLNSGDLTYELTVTAMTVEVSANAVDWITATDNGNGHWSATGITGLSDGVAGTLYVRLSINGEHKTMDGLTAAGDGSNDFAMFTVTP